MNCQGSRPGICICTMVRNRELSDRIYKPEHTNALECNTPISHPMHQTITAIQCTAIAGVSTSRNKQSVKSCTRSTGCLDGGYPDVGSTCNTSEDYTKSPLINAHISNFFSCSAHIFHYSLSNCSKGRFSWEWRWQHSDTSSHQLLIGGYPGVVCVPLGQLNNLSIC